MLRRHMLGLEVCASREAQRLLSVPSGVDDFCQGHLHAYVVLFSSELVTRKWISKAYTNEIGSSPAIRPPLFRNRLRGMSSSPIRPCGCQQRNRLFPLLLPPFLLNFIIRFVAPPSCWHLSPSLSRRLIEFFTVPSFPVFPLFLSYHPPSKAAPQGQPLCVAHTCFQSPVEPGSSEVNYALQPGVGSVCLLRCDARSSPFLQRSLVVTRLER